MSKIFKKHISAGITWVAIEEADVYICCGCPADTAKHLKKAGIISSFEMDGMRTENGPNAILLSDILIQNGQIANLTEFPILQMLYMQGLNLPNHPNYKKTNPILIGYEEQINMQLDYVSIGNHGLSSSEEIRKAGITGANAKKIFATKLHYSGGELQSIRDIIDQCILNKSEKEIKNGVFIKRLGINKFQIRYKSEKVAVDLNLGKNEHFMMPYTLPVREIKPGKFSVTHTGEGNGWDEKRPCMASVIHYQDKYFLIDAGPNILNNLSYLGIGLSEIAGVFLSHIHDDHFAGITELLNVERKLNLYSTRLIRKTAELKLKALMNSDLDLISLAFNCVDLEFDIWSNFDGLEVKPKYSPHTVETNVFNFRVKDRDVYKTYTHLSDTINLKEFRLIIDSDQEIFSESDYSLVCNTYLNKVNLKKIDVGGGAIHGHISDYTDDESDILVMAHTSSVLHPSGSNFVNVDFGETHILIEDDDQSYLKSNAFTFLKHYFNTLNDEQIRQLAENSPVSYHPGQTVAGLTEEKKLKIIISGLVTFVDNFGVKHVLDAGNFIGFSKRYFRHKLPEKYTALSFVKCLEYDESLINKFILKYSLTDDLNKRINFIRILRESDLIQDSVSHAVYNRFGKYAKLVHAGNFEYTDQNLADNLFIITKGKVRVIFKEKVEMTIGRHSYFGGLKLLNDRRRKQHFKISSGVEAICIPAAKINNVPKLLWKLLELDEKRYQISIFNSK